MYAAHNCLITTIQLQKKARVANVLFQSLLTREKGHEFPVAILKKKIFKNFENKVPT